RKRELFSEEVEKTDESVDTTQVVQKQELFDPFALISGAKEQVIVYVNGGSGLQDSLEGDKVSPTNDPEDFSASEVSDKEEEDPLEKGLSLGVGNAINVLFKRKRTMKKERESESEYESEEESEDDDEYESEESSDDEYEPPVNTTRSTKKNTGRMTSLSDRPQSSQKTVVHRVYKCTKCKSKMSMSSKSQLTMHAIKHFNKYRYKCSLCATYSRQKKVIDDHIKHKHKRGIMRDLKNDLREALWRELTIKCFPEAESAINDWKQKRLSYELSECRSCYKRVVADDRDLFSHIVNEHSDEKVDYDDPEG
ncbi:hypothetical protein PMAYCL1PPCAC_17601, partial [Pristionchus mayeri]